MIKIGITGQSGFVGQHLYQTLLLDTEKYQLIHFEKIFFNVEEELDKFVLQCDVIVHLAAMNRHSDHTVIYNTNVGLVEKLLASLKRTDSSAHVIMSSSSQEEKDDLYGKSKKEGRELLINWGNSSKGVFTGLIIPNVFGPFGAPFYNSFISTFSHQLINNEIPVIKIDNEVNLIYIDELISQIIDIINHPISNDFYKIKHTHTKRVSEILELLNLFKNEYLDNGQIPRLELKSFELNLFNTFSSYIPKNYFPRNFKKHTDKRGAFVEIVRAGSAGQFSYSTTVPGITRGDHYHSRKIERFAVISGKALIQIRKINSDEVYEYIVDGAEPAYVDMPIWYTHNIKNIGKKELMTLFWINEPYDLENSDTYFTKV